DRPPRQQGSSQRARQLRRRRRRHGHARRQPAFHRHGRFHGRLVHRALYHRRWTRQRRETLNPPPTLSAVRPSLSKGAVWLLYGRFNDRLSHVPHSERKLVYFEI